MLSSANLLEIQKLISAEHGDPHHLLGMHKIELGEKTGIAVRAFNPQAKAIYVVDKKSREQYPMEKIHVDGFFEWMSMEKTAPFAYKLNIEFYDGSQWETYDPYSFMPGISDYDAFLFGQGNNYQIFEKLGAHPTTLEGVEGVLFGVWAPNAKRISVIGDFNGWDGRRHPMRILYGAGIWELFIPGLQENDRYKYEIKTEDNHILEKSDPYGNFAELRPSTSSLVYDISRYKWKDSKWMAKREKESLLDKPVNIYEVHLGSWRRKLEEDNRFLSYTELGLALIPYVKEMGYTHIELMPVEEHPFDGSWGYQVTGYYAPTSRYGSPDEFMAFVDQLHQNGIGVLLDWVPAHFPKDAHGLARFDGTALYEHADPRRGEHPDWGTLIFNFGRNEVKNFLIANAIFWIEKYHIDGLRVDAVASMLYLDYGKDYGQWIPNEYGGNEDFEAVEFMRHMNSVILGKHPNVLMIAEESTSWAGVSRPPETGGLGFNLKWNMGWMNDFLRYIAKDPIFRKYHHNDLTFSMIYAYTENFVLVLSHDEVVHGKGSLIGKMPGDLWQKFANLRLAYGFMYGHPGKKLLFMGGEFAQFSEWSEARSLDWNLLEYDHHAQMQKYVKDLNHLYLEYSPLWALDYDDEGFQWISCGDWQRSLVCFARRGKKKKELLLIVCNFTPETYFKHRFGVPEKGKYVEILNSDHEKYGGSGVINKKPISSETIPWDDQEDSIELKIPPLGAVIFKWEKA